MAVGVIGLTNTMSLVVDEVCTGGYDEYVITHFENMGEKSKKARSKLHYLVKSGRVYFTRGGVKYYLDEIMRIS